MTKQILNHIKYVEDMRTEKWGRYKIRFVYIEGTWYAILKDACDALNLAVAAVSRRIPADCMVRARVSAVCDMTKSHLTSKKARREQDMTVVNEAGLCYVFLRSNRIEARQFMEWLIDKYSQMRKIAGLKEYETFRMLDKDTQQTLDEKLSREEVLEALGIRFRKDLGKWVIGMTNLGRPDHTTMWAYFDSWNEINFDECYLERHQVEYFTRDKLVNQDRDWNIWLESCINGDDGDQYAFSVNSQEFMEEHRITYDCKLDCFVITINVPGGDVCVAYFNDWNNIDHASGEWKHGTVYQYFHKDNLVNPDEFSPWLKSQIEKYEL